MSEIRDRKDIEAENEHLKREVSRLRWKLRDNFAGFAIQSFPGNQYDHEVAAKWCYDRADAMLKERER